MKKKKRKRGIPEDLWHGSKHHINPRSRGGPDDEWNIYQWIIKKHQAWHRLFQNYFSSEAISKIEEWILPDGQLNIEIIGEDKYRAWQDVFSTVRKGIINIWTPQRAIEFIEKKFIPAENRFLKKRG